MQYGARKGSEMSYVGFALIKLTKCLSGNDGGSYSNTRNESDNPFFFYEWTEWTRGGCIVKQETKVDEFLSVVKSRSITQGRVGYYKPEGSGKWIPMRDEMFEQLLIDWLDYSKRSPIRDEEEC